MLNWLVYQEIDKALVLLDGQPPEGFDGPGKALSWWYRTVINRDRDILEAQLGVSVFIQRSDGARPCGSNSRSREAVGAA